MTTPSSYHRNNNNILLERQDNGTPTSCRSAGDKENNTFYTFLIQLGTPKQTLQMNFDSASADTWVWSTAIPDANDVPNATLFDLLESLTFQSISGSTWQVRYGDGFAVSRTVGTNVLKVEIIVIENQAVSDTAITIMTASDGRSFSIELEERGFPLMTRLLKICQLSRLLWEISKLPHSCRQASLDA
ncbi:uncharacterized protein Z519_02852 [Cladophialophora bantiana CBS 173.52]|uniref:Peptidase A1 domain-containing protein n=1 Tax=Cladophialophora bantiana (strain ATCC 10958 / CBS 173.52 / CDC B-1940 / NIH 8579) TaxID=1442370 RepID=A0A0D2HQR2_CLAB1|nr:uncharacterized protein Z519_02852 [Cladophialophora bantiana CBS 173.52]KIW95788.1 hypothetical protein Z519_02852 [Cladophialophora bantiana CBS 173.52]